MLSRNNRKRRNRGLRGYHWKIKSIESLNTQTEGELLTLMKRNLKVVSDLRRKSIF